MLPYGNDVHVLCAVQIAQFAAFARAVGDGACTIRRVEGAQLGERTAVVGAHNDVVQRVAHMLGERALVMRLVAGMVEGHGAGARPDGDGGAERVEAAGRRATRAVGTVAGHMVLVEQLGEHAQARSPDCRRRTQ